MIVKFPNERYRAELEETPWRLEFVDAWNNQPDRRFFMLEWARRHRKTSDATTMLVTDCLQHPNWVSIIVAPFLVQAREILWDDPKMLFSILPPQELGRWKANKSQLMITFDNGSILRLSGGDKLEGRRGIDCNDLLLTEFAYAKESLWTKIFMPIMAGKSEIPRRVIFDYTPNGSNHATELFNWACCLSEQGQELPESGVAAKHRDGWWCSRVTNDCTAFLDPAFLKECEEKWPKALYDQEVNCARITEEERTLITSAMLDALHARDWDLDWEPQMRRIISCDPAFGGDRCQIYYLENTQIKDDATLYYRDPAKVIGELLNFSYKHNCLNFAADMVGNGLAIVAGLQAKSDERRPLNVIGFDSRKEATNKDRFGNLRAQAWWDIMQRVHDIEIAYPGDAECAREIPFASRYRLGAKGKIYIEEKDKIKEALGRSPDKAECWMIGQWALPLVEADEEERTRYRRSYQKYRSRPRRPQSAMA